MIGLWPVVGTTSTTQQFNLKNTAQYNLGFGGTWTHTSAGAEPGATGYAATGIIPSVINFQSLGSIHYSMYITENNSSQGYDIGSYDGSQDYGFISSYGNNTVYIGVGNGYFTTANGGSTKKNWLTVNNGGTASIYRDGSLLASGSNAINTGPTDELWISGLNSGGLGGNFAQRSWALASIGLGMDATQAANYNTAVVAFQTALSRQN
jgi:hypothetical protein